MRKLLLSFFVVVLAACGGNPRSGDRAGFDLGAVSLAWQSAALPVRGVEVSAPSWLASNQLQYRLMYSEPQRRLAYAESRWVAPPAELLERALSRQPVGAGDCRLRVEVDEWIQVFETPTQSRVVLELRASLLPPRGERPLARKAVAVAEPSREADARGGVAASVAAVRSAGTILGEWLGEVARTQPAAARACGAK